MFLLPKSYVFIAENLENRSQQKQIKFYGKLNTQK